MSTSATYNFGDNTKLDDLITEAYERIGIIGNLESGLHLNSALLSGNLELSTWPGKGLNLWMISQEMIGIVPGQIVYLLPRYTVKVLEVVASNPYVVTSNGIGSAVSSATGTGVASNCFNPVITTGWTSSTNLGAWIGWDFGATQAPPSIFYVGIKPLTTSASKNYQIAIDYALGDASVWNPTPVYTTQIMDFPYGQVQWFVIENTVSARAWRIRKVGGTSTNLSIQQIYFAQPVSTASTPLTIQQLAAGQSTVRAGMGDLLMGALSRSTWMSIANKLTGSSGAGSVSSGYYFNEKMQPTLTLYPAPGNQYTAIYYTNYRYAQDLMQLFLNVDVPPRFYDALVSGISARLATKFAPDKYPMLAQQAADAYMWGAKTDSENVTVSIMPDFGPYGGM